MIPRLIRQGCYYNTFFDSVFCGQLVIFADTSLVSNFQEASNRNIRTRFCQFWPELLKLKFKVKATARAGAIAPLGACRPAYRQAGGQPTGLPPCELIHPPHQIQFRAALYEMQKQKY